MNSRFLKENEFLSTKLLAEECFGSSSDIDDYYANDIEYNRVAVLEEDGKIRSMAHLKRIIADYGDYAEPVWYIAYVCTSKDYRNRGYMNRVIDFVLRALRAEGEKFTFLVPVNKDIYYNLGFTHGWRFNSSEADMLYADEGLCECFACDLTGSGFCTPQRLITAARMDDFEYVRFDTKATYKYFDYFCSRPNKSYYSVPLDCFVWRDVVATDYCILDGRCLVMRDKDENGIRSGCIPLCRQNELLYYFKLQEKYFNKVLGIPFRAFFADCEGIEYLRANGALDNYDVTEETEIYDYIYSADALRTLSGKKLAKKRNHINNFERMYRSRWQYRTLGYDDQDEILSFLKEWYMNKSSQNNTVSYGDEYDTDRTFAIELDGIRDMIADRKIMTRIKAGGIYIDGKLCAFSLGSYNPLEKMAVIEVEKAFTDYDGLYQLINREFLIHEFPDAELVNREDDMGLPGLRKSKMSYRPICFEKRYTICQKEYNKLII